MKKLLVLLLALFGLGIALYFADDILDRMEG